MRVHRDGVAQQCGGAEAEPDGGTIAEKRVIVARAVSKPSAVVRCGKTGDDGKRQLRALRRFGAARHRFRDAERARLQILWGMDADGLHHRRFAAAGDKDRLACIPRAAQNFSGIRFVPDADIDKNRLRRLKLRGRDNGGADLSAGCGGIGSAARRCTLTHDAPQRLLCCGARCLLHEMHPLPSRRRIDAFAAFCQKFSARSAPVRFSFCGKPGCVPQSMDGRSRKML